MQRYTFTVSDTLSKNLTLNEDSIQVKVNGIALTKGTGYTFASASSSADGAVTYTFSFTKANIKQYLERNAYEDSEIILTYSATLNKGALETASESNTAFLTYSSDPNDVTKTSNTPKDTVKVYNFDIAVDKYEGTKNVSDTSKKLANAVFVLYKKVTENGVETP